VFDCRLQELTLAKQPRYVRKVRVLPSTQSDDIELGKLRNRILPYALGRPGHAVVNPHHHAITLKRI